MAVTKKLRKFNSNSSKSNKKEEFSVLPSSANDFDESQMSSDTEFDPKHEQNGSSELDDSSGQEDESDIGDESASDDGAEEESDAGEEEEESDAGEEEESDAGEEEEESDAGEEEEESDAGEEEEESDAGEEEESDAGEEYNSDDNEEEEREAAEIEHTNLKHDNNESDEDIEKSNTEMDAENEDESELDYVTDYGPRKKRFKPDSEDSSKNEMNADELLFNEDDILDNDDDDEVLERVAAGKLKYGRTYEEDHNIKKEFINRETELKQKLEELQYKADWIERLDITCKAAPMALEMQHAIEADKKIQAKKLPPLNNPFKDMSVLKDDFEREVLFQRHAQAAVLVGVPMLQELNLYTRRNEEFYAEMVKSDKQMHKVRKNLREKLLDRQASEHARKLRKMRKFGKKVQAEVILSKAQKKKELMAKLKEYRQGQRTDLDFLDGPGRSNAADDDDVAPYVRQRRGAPAGRRGGGRRGRGRGRAGGEEPRMRAVLVGDGRSRGGRGGKGRGGRGNRAGPAKRKQMRGGNRAYDRTKRGFTR